MHQETPDEFSAAKGNLTFWFSRFLSSGRKSNLVLCNGTNSAVRNGGFVSITSQVFDGIAKTVKGLFDVRTPVFFVKAVFPFVPVIRMPQRFTGRRKYKRAAFVKRRKQCHKFALEFIPHNSHRNKKTTGCFTDFSIPCQAATGNNAVHMHMITEFLVPGVKDLDYAGCSPKPLLIRG